jgi:hypothetical protein
MMVACFWLVAVAWVLCCEWERCVFVCDVDGSGNWHVFCKVFE